MLDLSGSSTGRPSGDDDSDPTVIYTIYSDLGGRIYLKAKSYGDYLGNANATWNSANDYYDYITDYIPASYFTSIILENSGKEAYVLTVIPNGTATLVIPYFAAASDSFTITSDAMQGYTVDKEYTLYYYRLDMTNLDISEALAAYEEAYRSFVYENYLTIDRETLQFMNGIIATEGFDPADPNVIQKVAAFIQISAYYNLNYKEALDYSSNVVIDFLSVYREGVCRHYAAAATMLYRALGIPARFTAGYVVDAAAGEYTNVDSSMGHAWVEVYIDGIGWIPVEVTGSSNEAPDDKPGDDGDYDDDNDQPGDDNQEENNPEDDNDTPHPSDIIVLTPEYQCKEYDGAPLYASGNLIIDDVLKQFLDAGYTYSVEISGSRTEVGIGKSIIESFKLYSPSNKDVTDEIEIVYNTGTLEVCQSIIEIYLAPMQKYYDGKALSLGNEPDLDYIIINMPDGLILNIDIHISMTEAGVLTADQINASISDYITYSAYFDSTDVTSVCRIVVADIMGESDYTVLEITRPIITLRSYDATKPYDGTPLYNPTCHLISGNIPDGFTITYQAIGEALEIGDNVKNDIVCIIRDTDGTDVTHNFELKARFGYLTITDPED